MTTNLLSRKRFSTKTPAVCHPPPPPPPFPPITFQKFKWRVWVNWKTWILLDEHRTTELFFLKWASTNNWQGNSENYPSKPYVHIKFGVYFDPLCFRVLAWHFPEGVGWSQYHEWIDYAFYDPNLWTTGRLFHQWYLKRDNVTITIQQKPP